MQSVEAVIRSESRVSNRLSEHFVDKCAFGTFGASVRFVHLAAVEVTGTDRGVLVRCLGRTVPLHKQKISVTRALYETEVRGP